MKKQKIFKIYLRKPPSYLQPPTGKRDSSSINKDTVDLWWESSSSEFISKVKRTTSKGLILETIGYIIDDNSDVIFFSSALNNESGNYKHVKVISKDNVIKIEKLKISSDRKADVGDAVVVTFEDPVLSSDIGTVAELRSKCKVPLVTRLGFLLSESDRGVYTSSLFEKNSGFYFETMVNPTKSVKKLYPLI